MGLSHTEPAVPGATAIGLDGRRFASTEAPPAGVAPLVGHYHEDGDLVWAEFAGGPIRTGRLVGRRTGDGAVDFAYSQVHTDGTVVGGRCRSIPSLLPDGRVRLEEHWRRHDGSSGVSVIAELPAGDEEPPA